MPRTAKSATLCLILGAQVRARRRALGLSQAELASRLEVSTTYVQNVERGGCNLTIGQLERIAGALDAFPTLMLEAVADTPLSIPAAKAIS